ncbi:MAG: SLC13 family permease [Acidobacteria bacterium]|nr:SLC13 family permease [Acidobacteriota bacterium]
MQIAIVLGLLILSIILFAMERISVDIITLLLLIALVVTGVLTPEEAFAGFSNDIIIILVSIFVLSGALQRTGIMDVIGVHLHKIAGGNTNRLLLTLMTTVGGISGFMNNTTATAIFVPPVLGVAKRVKVSPSKLLMPMAYASILGGTCTLIGTSTNVAVSGFIARAGMKPLSLFEITPIGLIILSVGIIYMLVIGQRLLPDRRDESLTEEYSIREYLSEIVVVPNSHLIGQRIFESDLAKMDFRILEVLRDERKFLPNSRTTIEAGDILLVEGKVENLVKVKETAGIEIKSDLKLGDLDLQGEDIRIAEVLIPPRSDLIGLTLKEANFRQRYGMTALAIYRHGQSLRDKIGRIRLRLGDLLLVQGPAERLEFLRRNSDLWILEELSPTLYRKKKGLYTVIFFTVAIIVGGIGWLPLSISFLTAAVLIILFGCITVEEAYEFIDWRLIVLIAGMTAFGLAMQKSGAAQFLATWIVHRLEPYGVTMILAGFFLLTVLLTQPMSNAAAALVVLPIALHTAQQLGVNERTFAVAIMLAASVSFITPLEPSCTLVYGPGKYRFLDFVKTGAGLTLILMIVVLVLIPILWPLHPLPGHATS